MKRMGVFLCLLSLVGCGGGGSSPTISLALSPAKLEGQTFEGYSLVATINATATVSGDITGNVFVIIVDSAGVLSRPPDVTQSSEGTYQAIVEVSPNLSAGIYEGELQIKTCADLACRTMYGNTSLPYEFTVSGPSTSPPLAPLSGASNWSTLQGNAEYNAYVPVTLDPAKFLPRWRFSIPQPDAPVFIHPVVSAGNKVYLLARHQFGPDSADLYAVQENDGTLGWSFHFQNEGAITAPATSLGGLYLQSFDGVQGTLWSIDPSNGAERFAAKSMCSENCYATDGIEPAVYDGKIYGKAQKDLLSYPGLGAFDEATGTPIWSTNLLVNPMLVDGSFFSYQGSSQDAPNANGLIVRDSSTGAVTKIINDPEFNQDSIFPPVKVPGTSHVFVEGGNHFINFDVSSGSILWTHPFPWNGSDFVLSTIAGNGAIYISTATALTVLRESDGNTLWDWHSLDGSSLIGSMLVTDNLLFLSTSKSVVAIDLSTHKQVWSYPRPGLIALSSNGILYISLIASNSGSMNGFAVSDRYLDAITLH